ncbi:MAG: hypothetical protein ACKVOG_02455 [Rhodoglobus sp.]
MKLQSILPLAVLLVVLTGCSASPTTETDPGTDTGTSTEETTGAGDDTVEPWGECAGIIERLNANEDDPTVYEQLGAADFAVPEVGADVLAGACVIRVTINEDPITWAILPGDEALAESISTELLSAGFVAGPNGLYGDEATGRGINVSAFVNGAELDSYLVYSTAFAPVSEPIVYLGTFAIS